MAVPSSAVYVEPFVGGANMMDGITAVDRRAYDLDEDLICLWQSVSSGWMPPPAFSEAEYRAIRSAPSCPLKGYAAFALSYGGKKFGGWRRDSAGQRDYVREAFDNAVKQFPKLRGVQFERRSYESLDIPDGAYVYCDPPYAETTGYKAGSFDSPSFWRWARQLSFRCKVFVSEYTAPLDFVPVWSKPVANSLTRDTGARQAVESLWVHNPIDWD